MTSNLSTLRTGIFTPEQVNLAIEAVVNACKATKSVRRRAGDGPIAYVEEPDHPTRLVAAKLVIEAVHGKAVSMTVTADITPTTKLEDGQAFVKGVMEDPDARQALKETVGKIFEAAERSNKSKPLEITVTPALPEDQKPGS